MDTLPKNIHAILYYGKSHNGMVGAKVKATGDNANNPAWIVIKPVKKPDYISDTIVQNFEVEYLELREDYNEEQHGWDYDYFYVKKEIYYNIQSEIELINLLKTWISDLNNLKHISDIEHPYL